MYYMSAPLVRFWKSNIAIIRAPHICGTPVIAIFAQDLCEHRNLQACHR